MALPFEALSNTVLLAAKATRIALDRSKKIARLQKADHTTVTAADLASQVILLSSVAEFAPDEKVLAEESPQALSNPAFAEEVRELVEEVQRRSVSKGEVYDAIAYRGNPAGENTWFVDPIDGTRGYLVGLHYAVAVARVAEGQLENSWLAVPKKDNGALSGASGHLFTATRNRGAFRKPINGGDWEKLPARHHPPDDRLAVVASRAHDAVKLPHSVNRKKWGVELLSMDSQAKYAALAIGRADIYPRKPNRWFGPFFCWDHAAGVLLVTETGGVATDLAGMEFDWSQGERLLGNRGIFAASSWERYHAFQPQFAAHATNLLKGNR
ncbi:MAG: inositol monophosphatase family protein [bacterium]